MKGIELLTTIYLGTFSLVRYQQLQIKMCKERLEYNLDATLSTTATNTLAHFFWSRGL